MNSDDLKIPDPEKASDPAQRIPDTNGEPQITASRTPEELATSAQAPPEIAAKERLLEHAQLQQQKRALEKDVQKLQESKDQLYQQVAEAQDNLARLIQEGVKELQQRQNALQISVEQLERRRERIREEMRTTFAGVSQDLAIRVQGFKDYLVGSLQDLAAAAEQLELPSSEEWDSPVQSSVPRLEKAGPADDRLPRSKLTPAESVPETSARPKFVQQAFQEQTQQIQDIIERYRTLPDYYGPPWQLRRTFEPIHAERLQKWFFSQGGRGAIRTMGSRLQNILIASASISILHSLYSDRCRILILANTPERLGEWRRGLQDCLGISRSDFGPNRGIVLFEDPEPLVQKAERLVEEKQLPLIVIDETEEQIDLALLQFPLWLAFAPDPQQSSYSY